ALLTTPSSTIFPYTTLFRSDRDDLGEVTEFLEELLPLRDELVLRELYEHLFLPTRRRRSIGKAHIPLSPPSDGRRVTREFRSDRFHWNERLASAIIRRGRSRTRGIARNRRHVAGPRSIRDNSSATGTHLHPRQDLPGRWKAFARGSSHTLHVRSTDLSRLREGGG